MLSGDPCTWAFFRKDPIELAFWPTSDFDPQGILKIYMKKTSFNYVIMNNSSKELSFAQFLYLFYQKE